MSSVEIAHQNGIEEFDVDREEFDDLVTDWAGGKIQSLVNERGEIFAFSPDAIFSMRFTP